MSLLKDATVLVVDDEPDLCEMLRFEFEMNGCQVFDAHGGNAAFDLFLARDIDVVVTDIRMPGGNGMDLLENIRGCKDKRQPLVIFITAYDTVPFPREAFDRGADGFFAKPFRLKDMVRRVEALLEPPEQRWSRMPELLPPISVRRQFASVDQARAAKSCDIGRGGVALAFNKSAMPQHQVAFSLAFDAGPLQLLEAVGAVVWTESSGDGLNAIAGIEFGYVPEDSRRQLFEWLEQNPRKAFIPKL